MVFPSLFLYILPACIKLFQNEPLNKSLQLTDDECLEKSRLVVQCVKENLSFKAIDISTNQIIGIALNRLKKKTVGNSLDESINSSVAVNSTNKNQIIYDFIQYINSKFQLFEHYPNVDTAIDVRILSVNPAYQHMGVGGNLMLRTINYVQEEKIAPLIYALCSNQYTCKLCEKFKFEKCFEMNFNEYFVDGKRPLMPDEPNNFGKMYAKIL